MVGGVRDAVARWLRLVAADAELASYLVGVDRARLAGHLALTLTVALGGPAGDIARPAAGAWRGLGLTEAQHRRVVDYLAGVLRAFDVPAGAVGRGPAGLRRRGRRVTAALAASWSTTLRYVRAAAADFWCTVEDRQPGRLPERDAPLFLTALGRLLRRRRPAGRAALLRARPRVPPLPTCFRTTPSAPRCRHRRPPRAGDAPARHRLGGGRTARIASRPPAAPAGDGPAWWHAEVIDHDRPARHRHPDRTSLATTALPAGQAVPVCTPHLPGHWRWFSPANAPRADGTSNCTSAPSPPSPTPGPPGTPR